MTKKKKTITLFILLALAGFILVLLSLPERPAPITPDAPTGTPTGTPTPVPEDDPDALAPTPTGTLAENADGTVTFTADMDDLVFSEPFPFHTDSFSLKLYSRYPATIYYTLDGSLPTLESLVYQPETGIYLGANLGNDPNIFCIRAAALYEDGTSSDLYSRTYFVGKNVSSRYSTIIFSIIGDPADLTGSPDGIFFGTNYKKRGMESERAVHIEAWKADGTPLFSQDAGIRVYGGASRESYQKSMKLFARRIYDPAHGSFRLSVFDSEAKDGTNTVVSSYDKLVLRNCGNDYQFAFIRDELNQTLAKEAGFADYEAVVPAIAYLNGAYRGLYWLHENYCDDYFKDKYGANPANTTANEGEFIVLQGGDVYKNSDEDDEEFNAQVDLYQDRYWHFASRDLTDDATYEELCEWMDVENYLSFMAYDIYLCNWDWPNNNYKCYRYVAAEGEAYGDGVHDGRWRYLLHDTDYTQGLYGQNETSAWFDTLNVIINDKDSNRYSPLLARLLAREDCRNYFIMRSLDYGNGALSYNNVSTRLLWLSGSRMLEFDAYFKYLRTSPSTWSRPEYLEDQLNGIRNFAKDRPAYSIKYLAQHFSLGETYTLSVTGASITDAALQINTYQTTANSFSGTYFAEIPTTVRALLPYGSEFDYWEVNGVKVTTPELTVTAEDVKDGAVSVKLHAKDMAVTAPIISAVSAKEDDCITLYNASSEPISLAGYSISDGTYRFDFPEDAVIAAKKSLTVYCNNYTKHLPEGALQMHFNFTDGERISLLCGEEEVDGVTLPKLHRGYKYVRNLVDMEFHEVAN